LQEQQLLAPDIEDPTDLLTEDTANHSAVSSVNRQNQNGECPVNHHRTVAGWFVFRIPMIAREYSVLAVLFLPSNPFKVL
jgi:hypothetical protein